MSTDADFLGLVDAGSPGRFAFEVQNHLARLDGHLYGGTAIAVSIAAAELVSQRTALWMTTQFVATAPPRSTVSVHAEVLAPGRRTNQVRVTGTDDEGRTMFASLGATGHHKEGGLQGVFERPPVVDRPEDSEHWTNPVVGVLRNAGHDGELPGLPDDAGFGAAIEFRGPAVHEHPDPGPGRICLWIRRKDGVPVTAALAAFMADFMPLSIAHACGAMAGGVSLDNTIRIGTVEPTEWVLLDLRPHLAVGGYGHGAVQIWTEHGHLLATASQSASMSEIDLEHLGRPRR
jgi:acyl-CoA thioesterase-2